MKMVFRVTKSQNMKDKLSFISSEGALYVMMTVVLYGDVPGAPAVLQEHPHALTVALTVVFALVGNVDVDVGVGDRKVL